MVTIIPVASGKGGTGKSVFAVNLAVALAMKRKTVILIDLDLGSSNLHSFLGIDPARPGIGSFIFKKVRNLEALLIDTEIKQLFFIPGSSGFPATANLNYFMKNRIIAGIQHLMADYIICDLGAGSSIDVIDFFLMSPCGFIITIPEPTSIISAYSFIKSSLYRLLYRSFPPKSMERKAIYEFIREKDVKSDLSFFDLIEKLSHSDTIAGEKARKHINGFHPRIVINNGRTPKDIDIGARLRELTKQYCGVTVEFFGFLYRNSEITQSIFEKRPVILKNPASMFSRALHDIASKLIDSVYRTIPPLYEADEDLAELKEKIENHPT
jgi:flagellar biosynthesis protein FlhG